MVATRIEDAADMAWVTMGNPGDDHPQELAKAARGDGVVHWTIPSKAKCGNRALFYITGVQQLVAHGTVREDADFNGDGRYGPYGTVIENVTMIRPIDLQTLRAQYPDWGWARYPRHAAQIPVDIATSLFDVIADRGEIGDAAHDTFDGDRQEQGAPGPDAGVLENVITEHRVLARSRNRGVRDRCVAASGGVCDGCGYDYSTVAPARWTSILQAHHKTPLHLSDEFRQTTAADLIAFCPTCHVMAHLRRPRPYTARDIASWYA